MTSRTLSGTAWGRCSLGEPPAPALVLERAALGVVAEHLAEEERVAAGVVGEPLGEGEPGLGQLAAAAQLHERNDVLALQAADRDPVDARLALQGRERVGQIRRRPPSRGRCR